MPVGTLADSAMMVSPRLHPSGAESAATIKVISRLQAQLAEFSYRHYYRPRTMEQQ